jgi:hypothetical protein
MHLGQRDGPDTAAFAVHAPFGFAEFGDSFGEITVPLHAVPPEVEMAVNTKHRFWLSVIGSW